MKTIASFVFYTLITILLLLCIMIAILVALYIIQIEIFQITGIDIQRIIKEKYDKQSGDYRKSNKRD